jgi:hypothetical protein
MLVIRALQGSVQFALHDVDMLWKCHDVPLSAELMSENAPLVP